MKLIERYALSTGLKIGQQFLKEDFYPLPFDKYITFQGGSSTACKNYPYFAEVISFIKPRLDALGINILQIGGKDDVPIPGCYSICGKYSFNQGSYIVRNALLHLGNDSVWGHRAGHLGVPLVQPFGPTDFRNHSCYDYDPFKTIFIESHRWGRKPTFSNQESQSTMSVIPPEDIANCVIKLLNLGDWINEKTVLIGSAYNTTLLEWIPNAPMNPEFNASIQLTARMDLCFNEELLIQLLNGRKINIVTNKPINPNILLHFKDKIASYNHELAPDCPPAYINFVKSNIKRHVFFSRTKDLKELADLRFAFFGICSVEHGIDKTRQDFLNDCTTYLNKPLDNSDNLSKLYFKTNKYILSKGKIYPSHPHAEADISVSAGNEVFPVIDTESFWKEYIHQRLYIKQ